MLSPSCFFLLTLKAFRWLSEVTAAAAASCSARSVRSLVEAVITSLPSGGRTSSTAAGETAAAPSSHSTGRTTSSQHCTAAAAAAAGAPVLLLGEQEEEEEEEERTCWEGGREFYSWSAYEMLALCMSVGLLLSLGRCFSSLPSHLPFSALQTNRHSAPSNELAPVSQHAHANFRLTTRFSRRVSPCLS